MVALRKPLGPPLPWRRLMPPKRELYRERCEDEYGNHYIVIVWRDWPGLSMTSYTLKDGTPVRYEDEGVFSLPSGKMITRCQN